MAGFWDDWLPTILKTAVTVYGAKTSSDTQNKATQQANQATAAATQAITQSNDAATKAYLESIAKATENAEALQGEASPGLVATQDIIGRGEELTPYQIEGLNTARRTTLDALQGGSLRGSARATAETVKDVEGTMRNQYIQQNRNRSDTAAQNLSGQYFNAGNQIANLNTQSGRIASEGLTASGTALANSINTQGQNTATNTQNQAAIKGTAIGDIASLIADQYKTSRQKEADSAYGSKKPEESI